MTSFTFSDEWKNKEEWANCSREKLLKTIDSLAMAYQVTLMKLRDKDKEIARLRAEIADHELNRKVSKSFSQILKDLRRDSNHDR